MESDSSHREHSKDTTISNCVWKLRRYGQFLPEGSNVCAWKVRHEREVPPFSPAALNGKENGTFALYE